MDMKRKFNVTNLFVAVATLMLLCVQITPTPVQASVICDANNTYTFTYNPAVIDWYYLLQSAVDNWPCVVMPAGVYTVGSPVNIPSNRQLRGSSATETIIKAADGFNQANTGVLTTKLVVDSQGNDTSANVNISNLTVDGNNHASSGCCNGPSYGVILSGSSHTLDAVTITGARCVGLSVLGRDVRVQNSTISHNGVPATLGGQAPWCGAPQFDGKYQRAGIYMQYDRQHGGPSRNLNPVIVNTRVEYNTGPGMDINAVWGGWVVGSSISGNEGYAEISLGGANSWHISDRDPSGTYRGRNEIHASSWNVDTGVIDGNDQTHYQCLKGPGGIKHAGVLICNYFDFVSAAGDGGRYNIIENSNISAFYAVIASGSTNGCCTYVAIQNTIAGNNVIGSSGYGLVERKPLPNWSSSQNTWAGNYAYYNGTSTPVAAQLFY